MSDEHKLLQAIRETACVGEDEAQKIFDVLMKTNDWNKIDLILTRLVLRGELIKAKVV